MKGKGSDFSEAELATALAAYTDPTNPEWDPDLAAAILRKQPAWFSAEERAAVEAALGRPVGGMH